MQSSDETCNEEVQSKLWELSARLVRLEGYEPLEVKPPAPEEPTGKDTSKPKKTAKKDKGVETERAEENAALENGHGETEKSAEDKEKTESQKTPAGGDKIEDVAENGEEHHEKPETACNNGDCKTDRTTTEKSDKQEAHNVEVNGEEAASE